MMMMGKVGTHEVMKLMVLLSSRRTTPRVSLSAALQLAKS
jgi:hypothetical protein